MDAANFTRKDKAKGKNYDQRSHPLQTAAPNGERGLAANVQTHSEQLEAGHSDALTAYLKAMSRFHTYSLGNILASARQRAVT